MRQRQKPLCVEQLNNEDNLPYAYIEIQFVPHREHYGISFETIRFEETMVIY